MCVTVAFQAEDFNGYADRDALYFGAVSFHLRGDTGDMLAQVDDSASHVLPISQVELSPAGNQSSFLSEWILSWRLCSQLMDGTTKGWFFEGGHQRAVKLLREGGSNSRVDC